MYIWRSNPLAPFLLLLALAAGPALAQEEAYPVPPEEISPEAQVVLDRMTASLRALSSFRLHATISRDEVGPLGYKLQNNETAVVTVRRPDRLRADLDGDLRERTVVYDGSTLFLYSPDDDVYVSTPAGNTLVGVMERLADLGIELPLADVLHEAVAGTLTQGVRGGLIVGHSRIDGIDTDHLAFRQANIDWQLWVEQGARALPRKLVITTRYEYGDPQYQAVLDWDLAPQIEDGTFDATPPADATEVSLAGLQSP